MINPRSSDTYDLVGCASRQGESWPFIAVSASARPWDPYSWLLALHTPFSNFDAIAEPNIPIIVYHYLQKGYNIHLYHITNHYKGKNNAY